MCTTGIVSATRPNGEKVVLMGKTQEFLEAPMWHGYSFQEGKNTSLAFGLAGQLGYNSGLNEKGLCMMLSFLDYRGPFEADPEEKPNKAVWSGDERGLAIAHILTNYSNVEDAISYLTDYLPEIPLDCPGGNFHIADASGKVAIFEYCEGRSQYKIYEEGFTARGNNGLLILQEEQEKLSEVVRFDRLNRYNTAIKAMEKIKQDITNGATRDDAVNAYKELFKIHHPEGSDKPGTICTHNLWIPGGRTTLTTAHTISAAIFDLVNKEMLFTRGTPCTAEWEILSLE